MSVLYTAMLFCSSRSNILSQIYVVIFWDHPNFINAGITISTILTYNADKNCNLMVNSLCVFWIGLLRILVLFLYFHNGANLL